MDFSLYFFYKPSKCSLLVIDLNCLRETATFPVDGGILVALVTVLGDKVDSVFKIITVVLPSPLHPFTVLSPHTCSNMEKVEALLGALAEKGYRESKLKGAIVQVRKQLEDNLATK